MAATSKKTKKATKKTTPKTKKVVVEMKMKRPGLFGNVFFYIFIFFAIYLIFSSFGEGLNQFTEEVSISEVITLVQDDKVQDITVAGDKIELLLKDGSKIFAEKESNISFDEILTNNNVDRSKIGGKIEVEHRFGLEQIITPLLMFGFPLLILFFIFKQMRGQSGEILSFGKSRAKLFDKGKSKITFEDVAGAEEAKREMKEIVDFLKNPEKYRKLGARIPKGVLLIGASGVGKTLLAKAIAGEAEVPFFSVAGSEFMEMLVGVGSSRVRDLFKVAREGQPSLIFIDEVDAIGRQRGMGIGGGHDEREQTLNQILIEMDGFDARTNVIVLAATNRPDMLDPALIRPGRFDRRINISLPDLKDREEIIKIHIKGKPLDKLVSLERIAKKTVGFTGADLENMLNEAAILAARDNKKEITQEDLEEASLKVTVGSERRTLQTEDEKRMTAYHEAGHALIAANLKEMDPVAKVTIVARGATLGHTSFPPERDRYNETQSRLLAFITTALGGRAAEDLVYNEFTVGAADDIKRATDLARDMVLKYGMSGLGPISYESKSQGSWLAQEFGSGQQISEEMSAKIDVEIKKIVDSCYENSKKIIKSKRKTLDRISEKLIEKETLDGDEFAILL